MFETTSTRELCWLLRLAEIGLPNMEFCADSSLVSEATRQDRRRRLKVFKAALEAIRAELRRRDVRT
jgi:hypothetical protein